MEQENRFEFVVDEQYVNEKGIFTVLSIQKTEMVIRWESGEEIKTDIELQRNIQARREWEKLMLEKEALAAKSGRKGARASQFEGFKESDFKNSASGTKWRGRYQLGGAVTQKLPENKYTFNSWAFANKPEMHWMDVPHQKRQSGESRAKFFLRVDTESMFYGFCVAQPQGEDEATRNWGNFMEWLAEEESTTLVHELALSHELTIGDKNSAKGPALKPVKDGWKVVGVKKKQDIAKLVDLIGGLAPEGEIHLEVSRTMSKADALEAGKDISVEISELFSKLVTLYRAALTG